MRTCGRGGEGKGKRGGKGREGREERERGGEERGVSQQRQWCHSHECVAAVSWQSSIEPERESGERRAGTRLTAPAQPGHTHTRSHSHVLRPPHPHVHTKLCREQPDAKTSPVRSGDTCRYPASATPGAALARAPPRSAAGLSHNNNRTFAQAHDLHVRSLTRDRYTQTIS